MAKKSEKTNALRLLDKLKIPYEAHSYPCEEFTGGEDVARQLGLDPATALGMKKQFPTVVEQSLREKPFIYVSGGKRGLQLKLAPGDLVQAAGAMWGDVLAKG